MTTKLLCHFNGSDGATTVADAVGGVSWTLSNCELDTGRKKFGTAALFSASTADNTATATGFTVTGSGNFSVEGFHEQDVDSTSTTVELKTSGDALRASITFNRGGGPGDIYVSVWNTSGTLIVNATGNPASWSLDSPIHWALVRDATGGFWDFFFDGVRLVHESAAGTSDLAKLILWGSLSATQATWYDEVRITDTVAYSGSPISVPTSEFTLTQDVHSAEFHWELQPIDANAAYVHEAEFGWEAKSLALVLNVAGLSAEFGFEAANAAHTNIVQAQSAEFDFEVTSGELPGSLDVGVQSAEFTWELRPVDITDISIASAEFDREFKSTATGLLQPTTAEFGREVYSLPVSLNIAAQSPEFGHEIEGVGGTAPASITTFGAEFDWEAKSLALANNIVITGFERTWELQPVDIIPISPASSEYGREIAGTGTAANVASPQSAEFGHETKSVFLSSSASPTVVAKSAEFGWELQPITNIVPVNAEFGNEVGSVSIQEFSGSVVPPEFDWEASSVAITVSVNAQPDSAEFDTEIQSVQVGTVLEPGDVEFEREFGSAQISAVIVGQSAEFDYGAGSPGVTQSVSENEYDFEAGSPSLLQANILATDSAEFDWEVESARLPGQATMDPGSAEFDWGSGKVRLRAFNRMAKTPRDRVKICRQL